MAEFALVLPLLLFVLLGGIGIGLTMVHRLQLQHVAQEVAIEAATHNCDEALTRIPFLLGFQPDSATCVLQAQTVTVDITQSWPALLPFLPESIHVTSRALTR